MEVWRDLHIEDIQVPKGPEEDLREKRKFVNEKEKNNNGGYRIYQWKKWGEKINQKDPKSTGIDFMNGY